jgi:hypothetical protein
VPSGECYTFQGAHPNPDYTGGDYCCSYNPTPKCGATDVPDSECYYVYEFCGDGTVTKSWDSIPDDPATPYLVVGGTWSYVAGDLVLTFNQELDPGPPPLVLVSGETYQVSFMYDNGTKLDWFSVAKASGDSVVGTYAGGVTVSADIAGLLDYDADVTRDMTVSTGCPPNWGLTETTVITCPAATHPFCGGYTEETTTDTTTGPVPVPNGTLYQVGSDYVLQTSTTLVMEKQ